MSQGRPANKIERPLAPRGSVLATVAAVWGPGLLVMLADSDAGNVVAAAQAGSQWELRLLPLLVLLTPVLIVVQNLAVKLGLFRGRGFGELVRERFGIFGRLAAAVALAIATLGSLVTEFSGIAGVGELYGVSRWLMAPLASFVLIIVAFAGEYRRIERIALLLGLFEISFLIVAWQAHPAPSAIIADIGDQRIGDVGYLYLAAALTGASFNPWMIFYQSSAVVEKRLAPSDYPAARWDTIFGAILTQLFTASVLVAGAALRRRGAEAPLENIGEIASALTPLLGESLGRLVFGAGVIGAAMAAAIVSSLACVWGLGELFGLRRSLEYGARSRPLFLANYALWVAGGAVLVLFVRNLVWLSIAMQVLNALLFPVVATLLVMLAATALPESVRLRGRRLLLTGLVVAAVAVFGLVGAVTSLL